MSKLVPDELGLSESMIADSNMYVIG